MKNTAFHHALLVLALLFGQLVSGVHAVGHLQVHKADCAPISHGLGCTDHPTAPVSFSKYTHSHHDHAHNQASTTSVDENCSLYHSLLNLVGGILAAPSFDLPSYPPLQVADTSHLRIPQSNASLQRIRGPPRIS